MPAIKITIFFYKLTGLQLAVNELQVLFNSRVTIPMWLIAQQQNQSSKSGTVLPTAYKAFFRSL